MPLPAAQALLTAEPAFAVQPSAAAAEARRQCAAIAWTLGATYSTVAVAALSKPARTYLARIFGVTQGPGATAQVTARIDAHIMVHHPVAAAPQPPLPPPECGRRRRRRWGRRRRRSTGRTAPRGRHGRLRGCPTLRGATDGSARHPRSNSARTSRCRRSSAHSSARGLGSADQVRRGGVGWREATLHHRPPHNRQRHSGTHARRI